MRPKADATFGKKMALIHQKRQQDAVHKPHYLNLNTSSVPYYVILGKFTSQGLSFLLCKRRVITYSLPQRVIVWIK